MVRKKLELEQIRSNSELEKHRHDQNGRSPLHHAVVNRLVPLGRWLLNLEKDGPISFKEIADMCLWHDSLKKVPFDYLEANYFKDQLLQLSGPLVVATFRAACDNPGFRTRLNKIE